MSIGGVKLDTKVLDRMRKDLDMNTDQVLAGIAHAVEGEAKLKAPYLTGALKNSIITVKKKLNLYWVQDGMEYGIYQELGTSRMAAHPFMVPAVEAVSRFIADKFKGILK